MSNNSTKLLFLVVVIGVVLFSREAYPNFSILPSLSASEIQSASVTNPPEATTTSGPTISATSQPAEAVSADSPSDYIADGSTPEFSKVASTTPPVVDDAAFLVADVSDGTPLLSLNPAARWPMASVTKLMTAVIVFNDMNLSQNISITPQMFAVDPQEYTLQVGGTYTVSDLLHVLLLPSSNVAAEALAEAYGRTQFLAAMNAQATAWGMTNTYYDDPSGLSAANQSTADDLLILAQHVYSDYPQILAITRTPQVYITNLSNNQKVLVKSINDFAGQPDFVGGKTGHTDEASGNLLSIFNYEDHPLFILVLGTNDRFGDTERLYSWVKTDFK